MSDKLTKLKEVLELLQNDTVKPSDLRAFLEFVLKYIKDSKDGFEAISEANQAKLDDALEAIGAHTRAHSASIDEKATKTQIDLEKKLKEAQDVLEAYKNLPQPEPGEPGKDADEELIIEQVLKRIVMPSSTVFTPDTGEDIVNKINDLPTDKEEYLIDVSHIKGLHDRIAEGYKGYYGGGNRFLSSLIDVDLTGLVKNSQGQYILSSGGGSTITLQTNGVANGSQTLLNLVAGSNVTLVDNGTGSVTISASLSGGGDFLIGQTSGIVSAPTGLGTTETWLGELAGGGGASTTGTVFAGYNAGNGMTSADNAIAFGINAGVGATNAANSFFAGQDAGLGSISADHSVFLGTSAGAGAITANNSIFIGNNAGIADTLNNSGNDTASILIGNYINTGGFQNSILLGSGLSFAAQSNTAPNQFMLADSILYARWRGIDYTFPATQAVGPTDALLNDGFGNLYWSPTGTVSSVDVSGTGALSFTGGPITTSGTIFASFTGSTSEYIRGDGSLATFPSALVLQTNGTPNGSQALLNIAAGTDITLTDNGSGTVTIDSTASSPITIQNTSSLFSTGLSGTGSASTSTEAIYLGTRAGFQATSSDESVFIGHQSGEDASNAPQSVFLGFNVGNAAINADHSFFVGRDAGKNATNADSSQFIGYQAGNGATNANNSTFIGFNSGSGAANANNSIFIGDNAGQSDTVNNSSSGTSILIGDNSSTGGFSNSVAIGKSALNTKVNQFVIGSSYINFRARGIDYEWPSAQAAGSGYVLTNNGSGVLSWTLGGGGGTTIYTGDDSLTGSRRVELAGNDLNFGDTASGDTVGIFLDTGGLISSLGSPHTSGDTNIHVNNTLNKVRVEGGFLEVATSAIDTGFLMTGNINSFFQGNMQNTNSGASASTDWVVTADNGTATTHYADFGINSSGGGGAPFTTANHAYLYSIDDTLNIGALGASSQIRFFTTGGTSPVQRMVIDNAGLVGINQTTPTSFIHITRNSIGVTQSDAYGILLQNTTAAALNAQQFSPPLVMEGRGFATGTSANMQVKMRIYNAVVQNSGGPGSRFVFENSTNAGAYTEVFSVGAVTGLNGQGMTLNGSTVLTSASGSNDFRSNSTNLRFMDSTGATAFLTVTNSTGITTVTRRFEHSKGANVAAANDLTLGNNGNMFTITGNTTINAITTTNWQAGSEIILIFTGTPTVKHNTAGGANTAVLLLAGSVDLTAANNTVLKLGFDGTVWQEISRKVA